MRTLLLLDNIEHYYAYYLQSIFQPSKQMFPLPVFSHRPESRQRYFERLGYCVTREANTQILAEYLAFARDLQWFLQTERWMDLTDFFHSLLKKTSVVANSGAFIVGVGRSAGLGMLRALADGREFVAVRSLQDHRLFELRDAATSVYLVVEELVDQEAVDVIEYFQNGQTIKIRNVVHYIPVGFLHSRNFEAMTFLDAKQRISSSGSDQEDALMSVIVDSFLMEAPVVTDQQLVVKPYLSLDKHIISESGPMSLLSVTSHGMSDLIHLNTDYICGKSPFLGVESYVNDKLPSCMDEESICFFKRNGNPLLAYEIRASHVLINSCGSLRFRESSFDPLFNVSYSMLEGHSISFVGSLRWKDGYGSESLLYYYLVRAGVTLGDAVSLLNRTLFSNQLEYSSHVFCLIGDPEAKPIFPSQSLSCGEVGEGENLIMVRNGFSYVKLHSARFVDVFLHQNLLLSIKQKKGFFISAIPDIDQGALHIFVYSYNSADEEIKLVIEDIGNLFDHVLYQYRLIDQNLNNTLGLNKLYPVWIKQGGKKNLENRLLNISRLFKSRFTDSSLAAKLVGSCNKFIQEADQIDYDIAKALYDSVRGTSFRFSEHYQEHFLLKSSEGRAYCYLCGNSLTLRRLEHILRPTVTRTELICSNCGSIEDKPNDFISLQIYFSSDFERKKTTALLLRLVNTSEKRYDGYGIVSVRKSSEYELYPLEPIQKVSVLPGGCTEVAFEIHVGSDVPMHQYALLAAFVSTTQIYLGGRGLWVKSN